MTGRPKRSPRKRRLTEFAVRKARPEAAAYLVWDALQHGLALRVQPTGAKAWAVIYSRQGRPRWLHLGNASDIGLADARTLAAEAMLAVARGKDPAAEKKAERSKGTFAEVAERYVDAVGQEAQQVVAAGRGSRAQARAAAMGQAAGRIDHA